MMDNYFRPVSVVLFLVILLQSCAVYKHDSVSLEAAAATHKRILMVRSNDQKVHLKKVTKTDGKFYGVTRIHGHKVEIPLEETDIKSLRPLNRGLTAMGNTGFVLAGIVAVIVIIFASDQWNDPTYDFNIDGQ